MSPWLPWKWKQRTSAAGYFFISPFNFDLFSAQKLFFSSWVNFLHRVSQMNIKCYPTGFISGKYAHVLPSLNKIIRVGLKWWWRERSKYKNFIIIDNIFKHFDFVWGLIFFKKKKMLQKVWSEITKKGILEIVLCNLWDSDGVTSP